MSKKKYKTEIEALEYCFSRLKPSLINKEDYHKLKMYRNRFNKGKLTTNAKETLFNYFGITPICTYHYDSETDKSIKCPPA